MWTSLGKKWKVKKPNSTLAETSEKGFGDFGDSWKSNRWNSSGYSNLVQRFFFLNFHPKLWDDDLFHFDVRKYLFNWTTCEQTN